MKKGIVFLCVVAMLLSLFGCKKNYTHGVYEVTLRSFEISNYSVGNEWVITYTCDGRTIASGEQWIVPLDTVKTVMIDAAVTETDQYPDVGSGSLIVVLKEGFETSKIITVAENKGRYKGNKANWKITCKVKLKDRQSQNDFS